MQHLSRSLSSENKHGIRISMKQSNKDLSTTKIGVQTQSVKKYKSRHVESRFTSTSNSQSCTILAIMTGRGKLKHEVGLAVIDLYYPHLTLSQISDCLVYSNTLAKINIHQPDEIIMPEIYVNNIRAEISLQRTIARKFNKVHITTVSPIHFSALVGWDLIQLYCTKESSSIKQIIKHKHYALSAAAALLKYTVYVQHTIYAPNTVKIEFQSCNDSITLDIETVDLLEIVCSLNEAFPNFTLYNALNKCITPLGKKLLRSSLLQPLRNIACINKRIQCVLELVSNSSFLTILQHILKKMRGVEKLLSIAFKINKCDNINQAEKNLNYVLFLKNILDIIPDFRLAINKTSSLFNQIKYNCKNEDYIVIKELILELIQVDASSVCGYTSCNMQRCFAIKPKISELLDIIRQAYCELIDKMIQYVQNLGQKYLLQLTLGCNSLNGYYIQVNLPRNSNYNILNLRKNVTILKENGNIMFVTTEKLLVDSQKCKEICEEIHVMSNVIIENLMMKLRKYTNYFFQLCTDVGELDFIMSLASISKISGFVQPTFGHKLCFIDSYHPIQFLMSFETGVQNNVVASIPYNFQIITGPNLSGKTTYLKQIILLHILAQIGCFIPAQKATIRICDRFFFHSSNYYNMENNVSLYEYEMKRLSYIINFLTDYSLVSLDEPCMRTAVHDGTSVAVAICIKILNTKAFCFCTTHQLYMTRIAETFLNVTNLYFECYPRITGGFTLIYTHQLKIGITKNNHYGLSVAELSNFSESVLMRARIIAQKLYIAQKKNYIFRRNKKLQILEKYYSLMAKLYNLILTKQFTTVSILMLLKRYFSSEFIKFVEKNLNIIKSKLKIKSIISKEIFDNNNGLVKKNKSILLQFLMISKNIYKIEELDFKRNINNLNKISCNNLETSELLINSVEYNDSLYRHSNSSLNLKFLSSNNFLNQLIRTKNNIPRITYLSPIKDKNISNKNVQIFVKKEESNNISNEHQNFNIDLFYNNLLSINLSL